MVLTSIATILLIIYMIFQNKMVIGFYIYAGITILCDFIYVIVFLRMRYLIKNPQSSKSIIYIDEQKDDKKGFWDEHKLDKKYLLYYAQNGSYIEDIFSRIKKGIVISILLCIIIVWAVLCNTVLDNVAKRILPLSLIIFFGCIIAIIVVARMKEIVTIRYIKPEDIYNCVKESRFPKDYNPNEYKFVKFCMNFISIEESSIMKNLQEKYNKNEVHLSSQPLNKLDVKEIKNNQTENKIEESLSNSVFGTQEKQTNPSDNKIQNVSNRRCGYRSIEELKAGLKNVFNKLSGDFSGAKSAILKEVENGDANAVLNLGNIYLNGLGVELDKNKAYYYYRIAAYMGFASAIGYVGNYYLDEQEDLYKSLVWHSIAAKKKNAYAAVRAWQTLRKLSLIENNMYYAYLADILAEKAMEFGYPLKQRVPNYQPMNFPYTKEEKNIFIKKFNDTLQLVKQESKKEKEQIFKDIEIPEIIKNKIKSIDIFEQNSSKIITVEEPILGTPLKKAVKYLCEDSEVCVGDLMYFHYLDYIPEPVKIINVLDITLSKTEKEKLYSANYITWLSSNDNSLNTTGLDAYNALGNLINYYKTQFNEKVYEEFDEKLQNIKLPPINFEKLKNDSNDIYKLTEQQEVEQNVIIQEICVPLKRAGYLDSANKVYKYIYKTYGFSQVLMNSWGKIFVCNKQFDMAYRLFELGDNQYKYRIKIGDLKPDPITTILFGGIMTSQCYENMIKSERAMKNSQYALQLVEDMGGNPNNNPTIKLD